VIIATSIVAPICRYTAFIMVLCVARRILRRPPY